MLVNLKGAHIYQEEKLVLSDVDFSVDEGEFVYLIGKVGSGKSSILKTLYSEIPLKKGEGSVLDYNLAKMKVRSRSELRRQVGIVFQDFQLLTDQTVYDNLDFVLRATGHKKKADRKARIQNVLGEVGLSDKADSFPHELSGGEQQRVAIARAILNEPKIIFADEPTGNLDRETGKLIVGLLRNICERGTAVVMSTHNLDLLQQFPGIVYRCQEGTLSEVTGEFNRPIVMDDPNKGE